MRKFIEDIIEKQSKVSWDNPSPEMDGVGPAVDFFARLLVYGGLSSVLLTIALVLAVK